MKNYYPLPDNDNFADSDTTKKVYDAVFGKQRLIRQERILNDSVSWLIDEIENPSLEDLCEEEEFVVSGRGAILKRVTRYAGRINSRAITIDREYVVGITMPKWRAELDSEHPNFEDFVLRDSGGYWPCQEEVEDLLSELNNSTIS